MSFELLIVGDEILSGKRKDSHLAAVIEMLAERGLELRRVAICGDDPNDIAAVIRQARDAGSVLFSCGGIGATPDDQTRHAAALAFERPLAFHPEGVALIEARYGDAARPQRVRMAEFPDGAALIPNPVNQVAGFSIDDCHFVPGFPDMAWPMLRWVLDQHYADRVEAPKTEYRLRVSGGPTEGDYVALMEACLRQFPGLRLSSLPKRGRVPGEGEIEFGFRGPEAQGAQQWFAKQAEGISAARIEVLEPLGQAPG